MITPVQSARIFRLVKFPAQTQPAAEDQQLLAGFGRLPAPCHQKLLTFVAGFVVNAPRKGGA